MAASVKHSTTATGTEDPSKQIKKTEWNADHTLLGFGDAAEKNTGSAAGTVCAGDDSRLSNSRAPTSHAETHQVGSPGGSDPINVEGLSGRLLEGQKAGVLMGVQSAADSPSPGVAFDFLGIPSWAKKITVMLAGVSFASINATLKLQLGDSGGFELSGYAGTAKYFLASATSTTFSTDGFSLNEGDVQPGDSVHGKIELALVDPATNTWAMSSLLALTVTTALFLSAGTKSLSGTLDRIRLTSTAGAAVIDAGKVNVLYE